MLKNVCTSFMDAPKSEKLMVEIKKTKNKLIEIKTALMGYCFLV